MTSEHDKLLPCPHCGGEAEQLHGGVFCKSIKCAANGEEHITPALWNTRAETRATPSDLRVIREALGLHKSMVICGDRPTEQSEKALAKALEALTRMEQKPIARNPIQPADGSDPSDYDFTLHEQTEKAREIMDKRAGALKELANHPAAGLEFEEEE